MLVISYVTLIKSLNPFVPQLPGLYNENDRSTRLRAVL